MLDKHPADLAAFRAGLMRDKIFTEHLTRFCRRLVRTLDDFDAAAFAAPAGVNLRFDDAHSTAELLRRSFGLLRCRSHNSSGYGDTEALENFLGLKLVDVHRFRA